MIRVAAIAISVAVAAGCASNPETPAGPRSLYFDPPGHDRLRTTDGAIYLTNLQAQIDGFARRLNDLPSPLLRTALAEQLFLRFRIFSQLEDLERADHLVRAALTESQDPATLLLAARIDAAFHRFDAALALLRQLRGDPAAQILRGEILRATGQGGLDADTARPTVHGLVADARERLDRGNLDRAMADFHRALAAYTGADPYPLAWLLTQVGIAYLRFDRPADARVFFTAALERLPGYVAAKDHLAEALVAEGRIEAAVPLYRELIETSGDPEFCGVLAGLYPPRSVERQRLRRCATQGFARGLERHPEAFLLHAAEYRLDRGHARQALRLARQNLQLRSDVGSRVLFARAALANNQTGVACDIVGKILEDGYAPPELAEIDCRGGS